MSPERARPFQSSLGWRAFDALMQAVDHRRTWYRMPKAVGLLMLIGIRSTLRRKNLYDTTAQESVGGVVAPTFTATLLTERSSDGSWNDLDHPEMGMAGTRFGRNVPILETFPEQPPRILTPNPREISRRLMTRQEILPATAGNALIACWLQFMIRDWFKHGPSPSDDPWVLPLAADDDWPSPPLTVPRTPVDPTAPTDSKLPATHINVMTHWWDGSQIYGNSKAEQAFLREGSKGKLKLEDGLPPFPTDPAHNPTLVPGYWLGVGMMQTLFTLEHNAVCDRLSGAYPTWSDEQVFQRARLVVAALMAKIHTIEWTPAVTAHPTAVTALHANWYGLAGQRLHDLFGRVSGSEVVSGIPGSKTEEYGVPFALTEEFVAVYRMHPLIPDKFDFRSVVDDSPTKGPLDFGQLTGPAGVEVQRSEEFSNLIYTFGTMNPGLVTLFNYPEHLQSFVRPDGQLMDLAATDILRCRELGVPRYTRFRRLLNLPVPKSFSDLTSNATWAKEIEDLYNGDLDAVDLIVGMFAEERPAGFAFSDTAFRIFVLMASRRLNSDRFFTTDFTPTVYTPEGMQWIDQTTMIDVLLRHCPELVGQLRSVDNAFAIWPRVGDKAPD